MADEKKKLIEVTLSNNRDAPVLNNDVPSGVTLKVPEVLITKSFDADTVDTVITIGIDLAKGVGTSLVAAWLYEKFKQCRSNKITINRREINLSEGNVTQIIEESIKVE